MILTEVGREQATNFVLRYNGDSEEIKIIEAKTIYKGKEYKLDKKLIEDKPLASAPQGFDQSRQIMLAFPKIEIGAKLYLKYKFTLKKPPVDDFFAETFSFGVGKLEKNTHITIKSKLPLHILINDPENSLNVTKSKDDLNLEIILKKPIYRNVSNETNPIIVDDKYLTWVSVSSIDSWKVLAAKHGKLIAKLFKQKLPKSFIKILKKAKQKKSVIDKINTVTSMLNEKIRYMGDWRSVSGRWVPRDLDKISESQLGDCKDFSAATAAILTKLGLKAQFAVVLRGTYSLSKDILPNLTAFNHAMVKVTDKTGKVYWIDPTNFASMAGGIFPDIANKNVLIVDPKEPSYEKIPAVNYQKAQISLRRELEILDNNVVMENGNLLLKNEPALALIGAALRVSYDTIKDGIFNALAEGITLDEKHKKSMSLPKLDSRVVKDISIEYSFERENDILQTNVGPALKLTYPPMIARIYNISEDDVAKAMIRDFPATYSKETVIKNIRAKNINSLNKELKTPWLDAKREASFNDKHDLKITDSFIFYKNMIPREDFKNPEFIKLKTWLKENFKDLIIVFEPVPKKN